MISFIVVAETDVGFSKLSMNLISFLLNSSIVYVNTSLSKSDDSDASMYIETLFTTKEVSLGLPGTGITIASAALSSPVTSYNLLLLRLPCVVEPSFSLNLYESKFISNLPELEIARTKGFSILSLNSSSSAVDTTRSYLGSKLFSYSKFDKSKVDTSIVEPSSST